VTLPTVPRPADVATSGVEATAVYHRSAPAAGSTMPYGLGEAPF
jgi:hypothetical protein